MAGDGENETSLEDTPTYAVAIAAAAFIASSLALERLIHKFKKYLKSKNQKPLRKVLDKLTEELMLLGFISLLLTVLQNPITKICVSDAFASHMLPCERHELAASDANAPAADTTAHRRLLDLFEMDAYDSRRMLSGGGSTYCKDKGKNSFVSYDGLHQLHIFIFVLAITHVTYSLLTVLLGFARLHHWQRWEKETRAENYSTKADLTKRYCDKLQNPKATGFGFVDRHSHPCYENNFTLWILCFFQQFFASVSREDYLVFRVGFLSSHQLTESFNFRDYVIRSMEVDFRSVIGISWWLWAFVILFLLFNVYGWYTYFWAAFIPTLIILVIGAKQQHIISTLALQAKRHALEVIDRQKDDPEKQAMTCKDMAEAVIPSNELFWFERPKVLLKLIHFVIFQNSFELAVFFWLWATFGWNSCILGNHTLLIVRLVVGLLTQLLASYSTLPIYALVTQMGTHMKTTVFSPDVANGLQVWKARAKKHQRATKTATIASSAQTNGISGADGNGSIPEEPSTVVTGSEGSRHIEMSNTPAGPETQSVESDDTQKKFQRLYGKQKGLERLRTCQIRPRDQ
ncbi:mlo protein [Marchantia polymorpha subsp. ruderalis]|uniref:MLO-like protein n=2 Tax=Marchantia polymorpha TaxID=3197 RepID=A0AAF6B1Z0_MARPO|nr:hypothetical protein MARPO_0039s0019 [Marchantia polymorpha]BBN06024.1 hypothetical protein Mp_3g17770 [Marchantia polymorpha subsp. ruderalis]|eukprot:PTQ40504.1 hypothetical protein MARPO_0039s0019 [Marchantia polymorpha]